MNHFSANQNGTLKLLLNGIKEHYGMHAQQEVDSTVKKVQGSGIGLDQILLVLLPLVLSLFSGQKLDLQTIINALLALIPK